MVAFGKQTEDNDWSKDGIRSKPPHGPQFHRTLLIRDLGLKHLGQRRKLKAKIKDPVAWEEVESWLDTFPKVSEGEIPIYEPRPKKKVLKRARKPKATPRVMEVEEAEERPNVERETMSYTGKRPVSRPEAKIEGRTVEKEEIRQPEPLPHTQARQTPRPEPVPAPRIEPEPTPQAEPELEPESNPQRKERTETPVDVPQHEDAGLAEQEEEVRRLWIVMLGCSYFIIRNLSDELGQRSMVKKEEQMKIQTRQQKMLL
jgi:hypothetical protein